MMQYQLVKNKPDQVMYINGTWQGIIPFAPANTDYANFKKEILADEAQLQDADGNVMADAKAYVASLP